MITFDEKIHKYTYSGLPVPSVTQVLVDEGFIDTTWFTEEARNRGTKAHTTIKIHAYGHGCMIDPDSVPYLEGFIKFCSECDWKPHTVEIPFGSDKFAGTPDQIGYLNKIESVVDIKTGAVAPTTGLQLAGYEVLYRRPLKRYALHINGDGKYKLIPYADRGDRYIFESAVGIWWWKRNVLGKYLRRV